MRLKLACRSSDGRSNCRRAFLSKTRTGPTLPRWEWMAPSAGCAARERAEASAEELVVLALALLVGRASRASFFDVVGGTADGPRSFRIAAASFWTSLRRSAMSIPGSGTADNYPTLPGLERRHPRLAGRTRLECHPAPVNGFLIEGRVDLFSTIGRLSSFRLGTGYIFPRHATIASPISWGESS